MVNLGSDRNVSEYSLGCLWHDARADRVAMLSPETTGSTKNGALVESELDHRATGEGSLVWVSIYFLLHHVYECFFLKNVATHN